jgi:pimeloyl-ACP methyl ester carboxylesterase
LTALTTPHILAQTATSSSIKNIVFVHGAWADGSSWSKVIPILEARGYHVVSVQNPLTSFADRDIYLTPPGPTGCALINLANGTGSVCMAC